MKKAKTSDKKRDPKGRTPEQILREYGKQVEAGKASKWIVPYNLELDICLMPRTDESLKLIAHLLKIKDDRMELLRLRNPVQWAKEMLDKKVDVTAVE